MAGNRRSSPRRDACRIGALRIDGVSTPLECLVWDLSDSGAQIEVERSDLPDRFELTIDAYTRPRTCTVVRREGRRFGIVFTG